MSVLVFIEPELIDPMSFLPNPKNLSLVLKMIVLILTLALDDEMSL